MSMACCARAYLTPGQVLHRATRSRTFIVSAAQRSLNSSCICTDHEQ